MPMTLYTEEEYRRLEEAKLFLENKVRTYEELKPVWAHGTSAPITANALAQVWKALNVSNQTACMQRISQLLCTEESNGMRG